MKATARLIIDLPNDGAWNMAVDQALLESAEATGQTTLRLYRWAKPTLSLGYFQPYSQRTTHHASRDCDVVRRKTGGGAILHHHDLTYSLVVPHKSRWSQANEALYAMVHQAIIEQWASQGVPAKLYSDTSPTETTDSTIDSKAFLCFQRRSAGDIVLQGAKVTGSAQRRLKRSLLQHGSILQRTSVYAPELAGVEQKLGDSFDWDRFEQNLVQRLESCLHLTLSQGTLSLEEKVRVDEVELEFQDRSWLESR